MVNESEFKEGNVVTGKTYLNMDWNWFNSVPKWYWTYWSKLDLLRTAAVMKGVPVSDITEEDIAHPNNWMDMKANLMHGFGLKDVPFKLVFDGDKTILFGDEKHHIMYSDNKNFAVGISTAHDEETTWVCWSTTKILDPGMKAEVLKFVTVLGFKAEMAVETPFQE